MSKTKIEWTEMTWNPIAGCNDVSEGCRHCYARTMARRLEAMGSEKYRGLTVLQGSHTVWTGRIAFDEKTLMEPLRRRTPTVYFVNSMSDLFHKNVTDEMRDHIFAILALTPQHTYQVLTKRADQMQKYMSGGRGNRAAGILVDWFADGTITTAQFMAKKNRLSAPIPNDWLGVSVENQAAADERIPLLLQTPAAVRFISAEPLLGQVDLTGLQHDYSDGQHLFINALKPASTPIALPALDWVICGGESGPGARPMHPDWARGLRDACVAAGVPFFFKQWGDGVEVGSALSGHPRRNAGYGFGKKKGGNMLDGRQWLDQPEVRR